MICRAANVVDMDDLVERVQAVLPSVRADLEDLVRIESVWADPARRDEVHRSAKAVADLLTAAGFADVETVSEDGAPAVIADRRSGRRRGPPRRARRSPPPRPSRAGAGASARATASLR